jgi:hypothetical protein
MSTRHIFVAAIAVTALLGAAACSATAHGARPASTSTTQSSSAT